MHERKKEQVQIVLMGRDTAVDTRWYLYAESVFELRVLSGLGLRPVADLLRGGQEE